MSRRTHKRPSKKGAIYYALAIIHYLTHQTHQCLVQDVLNAFKEKGTLSLDPPTLLADEALLESAIALLVQIKAIDADQDEYAPPIFELLSDLDEVIKKLSDADAKIAQRYAKANNRRYDWLHTALFNLKHDIQADEPQIQPSDSTQTATSDREWEPLPLERESKQAVEAIEKTEAALREIESNNGYAATQSEERNAIVESIKGTLSAIRRGFPSRDAIVAGLVAPLRYIAKKFADASMGDAAKAAVSAILKWLF